MAASPRGWRGRGAKGIGASLPRKEDDRFMRGRGQYVAESDCRDARRRVPAQPGRACAHPRHREARRAARRRLHRGGSRRREADPGGLRRCAGFKTSEQPVARRRQGAPRRRDRSRCASPRRGPRPRTSRRGRRRPRGTARRRRHARGAPARRRARARAVGRQRLSRNFVDDDHREVALRRADQGHARISHRAPMHGADRRARRASRIGTTRSTSSMLHSATRCRTSCAPASPNVSASMKARSASSRPTSAAASATRAFCCRRRSALGWLAMRLRPSGALDRGPARASDRQRQLPRAPLPHHRLRRARRPLRGIDCEATVDSGAYSSYPFSACLEAGAGGEHPAGALRFAAYRCRTWSVATNKMPDPAVSRRRPHRRVLRDRTDDRRDRARAGVEPHEVRLDKSRAPPEADAVRQHHQQAFRQRRLSGMRCAARWPRSSSTGFASARARASRTAA